jgi:hypothetical protein
MPLCTNFRPGRDPGILDSYAGLAGLFTFVALAGHGALYLVWRTTGPVRERRLSFSPKTWKVLLVLWVAATAATAWVRPEVLSNLFTYLFRDMRGKLAWDRVRLRLWTPIRPSSARPIHLNKEFDPHHVFICHESPATVSRPCADRPLRTQKVATMSKETARVCQAYLNRPPPDPSPKHHLDADKIVKTAKHLSDDINARLPGSSLARLAYDSAEIAGARDQRGEGPACPFSPSGPSPP